MRLLIPALILAVSLPAFAASKKAQCKNRCDTNYQFCLNRATTKHAKQSCKTDHKNCKGTCR